MKDRIRLLRRHLGLSQSKFAVLVNCTTPYISMLESGKTHPSAQFIDLLCGTFRVRREWLCDGEEPMFEPGFDVPAYNLDQVGNRIRSVRQQLQLSQSGLAQKIDCSKEQIYAVESGHIRPSRAWLAKVSSACKVSLTWLQSGEGEMFGIDHPRQISEVTEQNLIQYLESNRPVRERIVQLLRENPQIIYQASSTEVPTSSE